MEGLGALDRLGLEGLLLFIISTLFSRRLLTVWRVAERFFAKHFNFLFENTSPYYLCVCISLPFLFTLFITAVCVINYGLECVTNLVIAYISYSAHILFDYKLVLEFYIRGSKRS